MKGKQAVVETALGTFVIELLPEAAPNHVGYFIKLAREGAYDGTTFHRADQVRDHPGRRPAVEGSREGRRCTAPAASACSRRRSSAEKKTRGAVAAVLQPGKPRQRRRAVLHLRHRPAGARRAVHRLRPRRRGHGGRAEDLRGAGGRERPRRPTAIEITRVTIRDAPPPEPSRSRTEIGGGARRYRAVLDTTPGPITLAFLPDKAPEPRAQLPAARLARRLRRHGVPPRRPGLRACRAACSNTRATPVAAARAEVRRDAAARVQRHAAREGHALDGARRRPGERLDVVLHLHRRRRRRSTASTRRSAASSTACRSSRPSTRRRSMARRRSSASR